eukprot:7420769-Alexandrium_andersonii.AAC.1
MGRLQVEFVSCCRSVDWLHVQLLAHNWPVGPPQDSFAVRITAARCKTPWPAIRWNRNELWPEPRPVCDH